MLSSHGISGYRRRRIDSNVRLDNTNARSMICPSWGKLKLSLEKENYIHTLHTIIHI